MICRRVLQSYASENGREQNNRAADFGNGEAHKTAETESAGGGMHGEQRGGGGLDNSSFVDISFCDKSMCFPTSCGHTRLKDFFV